MSLATTIVFATSNPHKLDEVTAGLSTLPLTVQPLDAEAQKLDEPIENGLTFTTNALIKATYYAQHLNQWVMADDSGLVVDALNGDPGVRSARYAEQSGGRDIVDPANNAKLIQSLHGVPTEERTARFVCVLALCSPQGFLALTRGTIEGRILTEPRGQQGFGYDPLFYVPSLDATTAEIDQTAKNEISHRGQALKQMVRCIEQLTTID